MPSRKIENSLHLWRLNPKREDSSWRLQLSLVILFITWLIASNWVSTQMRHTPSPLLKGTGHCPSPCLSLCDKPKCYFNRSGGSSTQREKCSKMHNAFLFIKSKDKRISTVNIIKRKWLLKKSFQINKMCLQINKMCLQIYLIITIYKQLCSTTIYFLKTELGQQFKRDMYRQLWNKCCNTFNLVVNGSIRWAQISR